MSRLILPVAAATFLCHCTFAATPVTQPLRPAIQPGPNSRIAHEHLLAKAKLGRIDVYFAGDSIVRRWGAADPAHARFLANWRQNFTGWNAADFGWGADRVENVLWRLQNGELDGVRPKVIVLLPGTNNPDARDPRGPDANAAEIVAGLRAIVDVCRAKAPDAVVIVTALFPRDDVPADGPIIAKVNAALAKLADGNRVRTLNINDRLVDQRTGRLRPGMMTADRLHPDVKGYQAWADALRPLLTEILGPPAKEDHAP